MFARLAIVVVLCLFASLPSFADHQRDWLVVQARDSSYEELPTHRALRIMLQIAESAETLGEDELAALLLHRANVIANRYADRRYHGALFQHAVKSGRLDRAEALARAFRRSDTYLDQLDVERYRRGDRSAINDYPREPMDFYNAMNLASAMVALGEYDAAEEFVTDIKISEENDPRSVTGLILQDIAERCRAQGDLERAKLYADKSVDIAGNLFYTGYIVKVMQRSIHGRLTVELDEFAQLGANHRGNQGSELVQFLIRELSNTGHHDEALQTTKFLGKEADIQQAIVHIAKAQVRDGMVANAYRSVARLKSEEAKDLTRLAIAGEMLRVGKKPTAEKLATFVLRRLRERVAAGVQPPARQFEAVAALFSRLGKTDIVAWSIDMAANPLDAAFRTQLAFQAFAERRLAN